MSHAVRTHVWPPFTCACVGWQDRGSPEDREEGGHVYEVLDARGRSIAASKADEVAEGTVTLTFGRLPRVDPVACLERAAAVFAGF